MPHIGKYCSLVTRYHYENYSVRCFCLHCSVVSSNNSLDVQVCVWKYSLPCVNSINMQIVMCAKMAKLT